MLARRIVEPDAFASISDRADWLWNWKQGTLNSRDPLPPVEAIRYREFPDPDKGKVAIFNLGCLLLQARARIPVRERSTQMVAIMEAGVLAPRDFKMTGISNDHSRWAEDFFRTECPVYGRQIAVQDVFRYQDPDVMAWIREHNQPLVKTYDLNAADSAERIPIMPAAFGEAMHQMAFLEQFKFGHNDGVAYYAVTRQELVGPGVREMRGGLTVHTDTDLRDPEGKKLGAILRTWNCVSHVPTEMYRGNKAGVSLEEVTEKIETCRVWGHEDRIPAYMTKIGAQFSSYAEGTVFGFCGQKEGWPHRAQPLETDERTGFVSYFSGGPDGEIVTLEQPTLRNFLSLFVVQLG